LTNFVKDEINTVQLNINWNHDKKYNILLWTYLILDYFKNFETLDPVINSWLISVGANGKQCRRDSDVIQSEKRMNTSKRIWFFKIKYNNFNTINELLADLNGTYQYYYGNILTVSRTVF
jgi:hypothetical protein